MRTLPMAALIAAFFVTVVQAPDARAESPAEQHGEMLYSVFHAHPRAVGAGMGRPPFATNGLIAYLDARIDGHRYMMSTAPIIYGNSGGALFRFSGDRDRYELIGVPSRGTVAGFSIVEHMNWSIVIDTIRAFLRGNGHGFILGDEPEE